jgi:hypothetical protein
MRSLPSYLLCSLNDPSNNNNNNNNNNKNDEKLNDNVSNDGCDQSNSHDRGGISAECDPFHHGSPQKSLKNREDGPRIMTTVSPTFVGETDEMSVEWQDGPTLSGSMCDGYETNESDGMNNSDHSLLQTVQELLHSNQTFTLSEGTSLDQEMQRLKQMKRKMNKSNNNVSTTLALTCTASDVSPWKTPGVDHYGNSDTHDSDPLSLSKAIRLRITSHDIEQQKDRLRSVLKNATSITSTNINHRVKITSHDIEQQKERLRHVLHHAMQEKTSFDQSKATSRTRKSKMHSATGSKSKGIKKKTKHRSAAKAETDTPVSDFPCRQPRRLPSSDCLGSVIFPPIKETNENICENHQRSPSIPSSSNKAVSQAPAIGMVISTTTCTTLQPPVSPITPVPRTSGRHWRRMDSSSTISTNLSDFSPCNLLPQKTYSCPVESIQVQCGADDTLENKPNRTISDFALKRPTRCKSNEHMIDITLDVVQPKVTNNQPTDSVERGKTTGNRRRHAAIVERIAFCSLSDDHVDSIPPTTEQSTISETAKATTATRNISKLIQFYDKAPRKPNRE